MKKKTNIWIALSHCLAVLMLAVCAYAGIIQNTSQLGAQALDLDRQIQAAQEASEQSDKMEQEPAAAPAAAKQGQAETDLKDGVYYGTGVGYGGGITVKLTVKDGRVTGLEVVSAPDETPAFLHRAEQVTKSIVQASSADVDGITGATLSSNGIKAAAAAAIKKAGGKGNVSLEKARAASVSKPVQKKVSYQKPAGGWNDGTYTGSARGFGGTVSVKVTIRNGKITSIQTSGKHETSSYWNRAQAVKGRIIKAQNPKVDAVSGATYSSNGIMNAVISALNKAASKGRKAQTICTADEEYEVTVGRTVSLKAKAETKLTYRSTDPSVASVDRKGTVTGLHAGTSKIRIRAAKSDKYKKAAKTVKVIVVRKEQTVTIAGCESQLELTEEDIGKVIELNASAESGAALAYASDAPETASVNENGTVTIKGTGSARITVTAPETEEYEEASASVLIRVSGSGEEAQGISGTFTGKGQGYGGPVICEVTIENSRILEIEAEGEQEGKKYWFKAKKIIPKMVQNQTWDVDAVSGATMSSNGIREAVRQALQEAGLL